MDKHPKIKFSIPDDVIGSVLHIVKKVFYMQDGDLALGQGDGKVNIACTPYQFAVFLIQCNAAGRNIPMENLNPKFWVLDATDLFIAPTPD